MKRILLSIFLLLLNSCSLNKVMRSPSSLSSETSCSNAMKGFLFSKNSWREKVLNKIPFRKKSVESLTSITNEKLYYWINVAGHSTDKTKNLHEKFINLPLSEDQFQMVLREYDHFPKTTKKTEELYFYLSYASSFHEKKKLKVLNDLKFVKTGRSKNSKEYQKFLKSREKFKNYETKKIESLTKKYKKDSSLSEKQVGKLAKKEAKVARENFENLSYACSAKVKTADNAIASKRFQKFALVVTPISTASMFTFANREELAEAIKEEDQEKMNTWVKKLGYEVVLMSALNMILAKIMSEPTGSYFSKVWKGAASDLSLIKVDSMIYGKIFSASDEDLTKRFDELKSNPEYKNMLKEMNTVLEKGNAYQSFKDNMYNTVKGVIPFMDLEPKVESKIDLTQFSKEELEDPKVKDAILKAITIQMYEEDKGVEEDALASLIHTGDKGEDRMFFFMEVAPIYHSINVGIGALIYQTICMGKNNPSKAFRNAAMIYAGWSFGYNLFEFSARQHQIGQ